MRQHARLMVAAGNRVRIVAGRGQAGGRGRRVHQPAACRFAEFGSSGGKIGAGCRAGASRHLRRSCERIEKQLRPVLDEADWLICHNVCSLNKNLALTAAIHRVSESQRPPRLILWHHDLAWTTPRYRKELHDGLSVVIASQRLAPGCPSGGFGAATGGAREAVGCAHRSHSCHPQRSRRGAISWP